MTRSLQLLVVGKGENVKRNWLVAMALVAQFAACIPIVGWAGESGVPQIALRMDQVVQSYADTRHFMGAVLVDKDGETLFDRGYGYANLEWAIPNSPQTKFRLGSITKQFTAAAVLLLEEIGSARQICDGWIGALGPLPLGIPTGESGCTELRLQ